MKFDILKPQVLSEIGKQTVMEDATWPTAQNASIRDRLFIVCDGLGGKDKGDVASKAVTQAVADYLFQNTCPDEPLTNDMLKTALMAAYECLADCPVGVGTSLAMLYMHRKGCAAVHIGDSRIYHVRPSANALLYKSTDDFKVMVAQSSVPVTPEVVNITNVRPGDYFLLCTKSTTAHLTDAQVVGIICGEGSDGWKRRVLRERTEQVDDNHSAIMVQVSGVMTETTDTVQQVADDKPKKPEAKPVQTTPRNEGRAKPAQVADDEGQRRSFPVVGVTAAVIVLAGILLWWLLNRDTARPEEPVPAVVEQKDSVKEKDTMKIVNTKAEVKADTTRRKPVDSSYRQKADSLLNSIAEREASQAQAEGTDVTEPAVIPQHAAEQQPAAQPDNQIPTHQQQPDNQIPTQKTDPTTQQNNNGAITPRPVIPEE